MKYTKMTGTKALLVTGVGQVDTCEGCVEEELLSPKAFDLTTESPYKYGGKEWNTTTSTYDFEARQLSPSFLRFTSMDPLCEKYYSISPYAY